MYFFLVTESIYDLTEFLELLRASALSSVWDFSRSFLAEPYLDKGFLIVFTFNFAKDWPISVGVGASMDFCSSI